MSSVPVVAVVGRPNVGKSTLVNRIIGSRSAVVEELPGVTRDRREFSADWAGHGFLLVDTGGWEVDPSEDLVVAIREQAEAAVRAADAVLFVVDATTGISPDDAGVARLLHDSGTPILLVANKVDDAAREADVHHLWSLGVGQPYPVSALHGRGAGELLDALVAALPDGPGTVELDGNPSLAIVGRPNVGKSTLLNRLTGTQRVLVSPTPGTTRDPIDAIVELDGVSYRVVDTAGIRRQARIAEDADHYAVLRARKALADSDVAVLLVDAVEGVTSQDQRVAEEVVEAGAGLVVLLNKWDAADTEQRELTERGVGQRLGFVSWAPLLRGLGANGGTAPPSSCRGGNGPDQPGDQGADGPAQPDGPVLAGGAPSADAAGEEAKDPLRHAGRGPPTDGASLRLGRRAPHRLPPIPGEPVAQGDRPDRYAGAGGGPEEGWERQAGRRSLWRLGARSSPTSDRPKMTAGCHGTSGCS